MSRKAAGDNALILKGNRDGVAIIIDQHAHIDAAVSQLRAKLQEAGDFFRGAAFRLEVGDRELAAEEREATTAAIEEFGVRLNEPGEEEPGSKIGLSPRHQAHLSSDSTASLSSPHRAEGRGTEAIAEATLLIRRTVRSGQRIEYDGNVVVMGDVNAGAVVTCTGDIIVLGALRGLAHAGAEGNEDAVVVAFRLEPTQLRIAQYISRSPDEYLPGPKGPEEARVKNGMIVIEEYVP